MLVPLSRGQVGLFDLVISRFTSGERSLTPETNTAASSARSLVSAVEACRRGSGGCG